ncbi:hypothetical protein N7450_000023 [Penicillium hetheringtonii]|uniref:Zn(2)-C6 fungal-type domain-containing protein n=1 Tax=Penicillium hetheringtonii TaxID=911720 RepID=A0AAD6E1F3_9EURO|nr:hypothetical protein N7450_000023 [Penicillium hetheringtonii]
MVKHEMGIQPKRKSRGRGLRATTGCIICKRRHVKCDEARPQCGPCKVGSRSCFYNHDLTLPPDESKSLPEFTRNRNGEPKSKGFYSDGSSKLLQRQRTRLPSNPGSGTGFTAIDNKVNETPFSPSPAGDSVPTVQVAAGARLQRKSNIIPCPSNSRKGPYEVSLVRDWEHHQVLESPVPYTAPDTTNASRLWWVSEHPIPVSGLEILLFRHFVYTVSKILDFHDEQMNFATTVPHLALQNMGLMKALLALSALHFSLYRTRKHDFGHLQFQEDSKATAKDQESAIFRNSAVKYYVESMHYLNSAMQSSSQTQSSELAAAAILISTYEMIDGDDRRWEEHIQGIFWFQIFQESDCEAWGFRSAIWWAWFQQDIWIAIRHRCRTNGIWKPQKHIKSLSAPELARRAFHLLAQCVNYISQEEKKENATWRAERGNELLRSLQDWREALPKEYNPLPLTSNETVFPLIWVNPTSYAAALQVQSLALILVIQHHPSLRCYRL